MYLIRDTSEMYRHRTASDVRTLRRVVNERRYLFRSNFTGSVAEYKEHGVNDVALAAAVRSYYSREAFVERTYAHFAGVAFEIFIDNPIDHEPRRASLQIGSQGWRRNVDILVDPKAAFLIGIDASINRCIRLHIVVRHIAVPCISTGHTTEKQEIIFKESSSVFQFISNFFNDTKLSAMQNEIFVLQEIGKFMQYRLYCREINKNFQRRVEIGTPKTSSSLKKFFLRL